MSKTLESARDALRQLNEMKAVSHNKRLPIAQSDTPDPTDLSQAPAPEAGEDNSETIADAEGGAWEQLDSYIDDLAASVCAFWDCEWQAAQDCFVAAIQGMAEQGLLPPFPQESATEAEVFAWLAQAKGAGLNRFLNDMCRQMGL